MGTASPAPTPGPAARHPGHGAAADHMRNAGPGWYYDPEDRAIYRYWDGHRWTDHRSDTVLSEIPS